MNSTVAMLFHSIHKLGHRRETAWSAAGANRLNSNLVVALLHQETATVQFRRQAGRQTDRQADRQGQGSCVLLSSVPVCTECGRSRSESNPPVAPENISEYERVWAIALN
jgi:hypothetical protein